MMTWRIWLPTYWSSTKTLLSDDRQNVAFPLISLCGSLHLLDYRTPVWLQATYNVLKRTVLTEQRPFCCP